MADLVVDTQGSRYALGPLLGSGGQGTVYAVEGRALAVKLMHTANLADDLRCKENISRVRLLELAGLKIARPKCALREPHVGYVMDLMTGMVPLRTMLRPPRHSLKDADAWYQDTGGLLRRLRLLSKLASLLAELHARGMVFGDASPNNVFVSEDSAHEEVWLIDADNITQGAGRSGLYTPGYGAPELVRRESQSDSLTDAWSLATMVFESLACLHPFRDGVYVNEGEPELEHEADCGRVPWVDDEADNTNRSRSGIQRVAVLTLGLNALAHQCFSGSRLERQARPGVSRWASELRSATDQVVVCPQCGRGYVAKCRACPWCEAARPALAVAIMHLRDTSLTDANRNPRSFVCKEKGKLMVLGHLVIQEGRSSRLTSQHLGVDDSDDVQVTVSLSNGKLVLEGDHASVLQLIDSTGQPSGGLAGSRVEMGFVDGQADRLVIPSNTRGVHRVVRFQHRKEIAK